MHILTLFPQLLTYGLLAPFLLRITVGIYGLLAGLSRYKKPYKWTSVLYFITGILLILGLYTQVTAIVGVIIVIWDYWMDSKTLLANGQTPMTWEQKMLRKLVAIVLLSLIFTGPGFFAIDLPL